MARVRITRISDIVNVLPIKLYLVNLYKYFLIF